MNKCNDTNLEPDIYYFKVIIEIITVISVVINSKKSNKIVIRN